MSTDLIDNLLFHLVEYLTGKSTVINNGANTIIRKHSRKLEQCGDISFPLSIKNWTKSLLYEESNNPNYKTDDSSTIFDYVQSTKQMAADSHLERLIASSNQWSTMLHFIKGTVLVPNNDVCLSLNRTASFKIAIEKVLASGQAYGSNADLFIGESNNGKVCLRIDTDDNSDNLTLLSELRLIILQKVTAKLIDFVTTSTSGSNFDSESHPYCDEYITTIKMTLKSNEKDCKTVVCGSVVNDKGLKDTDTTAKELYDKRFIDMRLMAQHKYGIQIQSSENCRDYFEKLAKSAVTIEMLQNKPRKNLKILLNDLRTSNKGASFIFYNCARLAALFRKFNDSVRNKIYTDLPPIKEIDFSLLNQPEEWELLYVYILQFPTTLADCIRDIHQAIVNPQYLVTFLSSLSSVFSVYYRRVRILTDPRQHLFAVLHARIYLLMALQQVFHNALHILNIEPIKEM